MLRYCVRVRWYHQFGLANEHVSVGDLSQVSGKPCVIPEILEQKLLAGHQRIRGIHNNAGSSSIDPVVLIQWSVLASDLRGD